MVFEKIIKKIRGNKDLPKPVEVPEEEEYEVIGEETQTVILDEEEKKEEVKEIIKIEKILPKLFVVRIKHPLDFREIKGQIPDYDVIIINFEEVPEEAIIKEITDFKSYLDTINYRYGLVSENVLLCFRNDVELDKYVSKIKEDVEEIKE
ncbi:hypothetical protein J422_00175 [Methanocaldococcus villosus KIN24-T80]|uniref:Cell division protein SepF n=1 Tax=Methanocaldococcus villosus KIN24-T80 TaxID=1069083 RepID=N6V3I2_9EURY|nr:hypothetical protein [Methanocaldococcus villosus]ENN96818.1 hypothetical protein J422_00175 [Methanocaldococcus villosus KIN24-T80]